MKNKETGPKSPGTMMLYATKDSLVKRLIEDKDNSVDKEYEIRNPKINRFGFIGELLNGFISDGKNKLEINFHEKTDLSLIQNRGFSLFFWFLAKKQPQGALRYILKQGNNSEEITPSIGFLPNCSNLFVKILSSRHRQETLYSTKTIEPNRLYSLTVTFAIDYENELTDIYLYLDGILDSQISIPGEPLHNQGKMHVGKVDKNSLGFIGYVADILVVPRVLGESEISQISKACFINLVNNANNFNSYSLRSYEIFERKFERDKLMEKYAKHTGSPLSVLENLQLLNDELRDIVRKFDDENLLEENENNENNDFNSNNNNYSNSQNLSDNNYNQTYNGNYIRFRDRNVIIEDHKVLLKLQQYLEYDESEKAIFFRKLAMNASFIYSVLFLLSEDQQNLGAKRLMNILDILRETLHMQTTENDLLSLAKILSSFEAPENVNIMSFIKNAFYFTKILYPDLNLNLVNSKQANKYKSSANFNNLPSSSAGFYMNNNASYSQTGFYPYGTGNKNNNYGNEPLNSVDLHENFLLRSSQQFANVNAEDEFEPGFAQKSTFSIKSLYSRPKTGRPGTTRGGFGSGGLNNNMVNYEEREEDYVNQNFDDFGQDMNIENNVNDVNNINNANNNNLVEKYEKENSENKDNIVVNNNNINNSAGSNLLSTPKLQENDTNNANNAYVNSNISLNVNSNPNAGENAHTFNEANKDNKNTRSGGGSDKDGNTFEENYDNGFDNAASENIENSRFNKVSRHQTELEANNLNNDSRNNNNSELNNNKHKEKTEANQKENLAETNTNLNNNNSNLKENAVENKNVISNNNNNQAPNEFENKNEMSGFVSDLNTKLMGKQFEETKEQFSDPNNLIHIKVSQNQMIDHNIQVDGNKIEEEYKEEENMDMGNHEDHISVIDLEAKYPDDWNMGAFELVINHCFNCHKHKTTTRHYEFTYVDKFNELGDSIKEVFPNVNILGNPDKIDHLGCFDVYIRGVGPHLDDNGRYLLYSKKQTRKFPTKSEIVDKLVTLSMLYGSSCNMEAAQAQYIKAYSSYFPKQSPIMSEHPANLSEEAEKEKAILNAPEKEPVKIDPERTKFSCMNFGCAATFTQSENHSKVCCYHPGIWQFGSYNAYWPEAWSCCERGWNEQGCQRGAHKGVRLETRINLCIKFGQVNPKTGHPDSACGVWYSKDSDGCKFHSGFFNQKSQAWSCCDMGDISAEGCIQGKHATVFWPDEKAKLYFYPKALNNPGLIKSGNGANKASKLPSMGQQICKCDFFKPIKQYENPATKFELLKIKRNKEKEEMRICFRWACEKTYIEFHNSHKTCLCHPGKWDHGSTGTKMVEFISEFALDPKNVEKKTILWRPHWTCCGGDWEKKGCKLMRHSGPLIEEAENYGRKYHWPDLRAKLNFPKIVSNKWKKSVQQYIYSEDKVKAICRKFFTDSKRSVSELPALCDSLRLYLLVVNENIDYQLKFMDIATQSNSVAFFSDSNGDVNPQKFLKWWLNDYESIINSILEKK